MDFLGMERAERIVRDHEEGQQPADTLSSPPFSTLNDMVGVALQIAAEQGGWLNVRQATAILQAVYPKKDYRDISSPLFKSKDIKRVPAPLASGEVRLEINSFITYLREFKPRKGRTENE